MNNNVVVVDTSIAVKWIIDQPDSGTAMALLAKWISDGTTIIAPYMMLTISHWQNEKIASTGLRINDCSMH